MIDVCKVQDKETLTLMYTSMTFQFVFQLEIVGSTLFRNVVNLPSFYSSPLPGRQELVVGCSIIFVGYFTALSELLGNITSDGRMTEE
jgi:hypothetical protein